MNKIQEPLKFWKVEYKMYGCENCGRTSDDDSEMLSWDDLSLDGNFWQCENCANSFCDYCFPVEHHLEENDGYVCNDCYESIKSNEKTENTLEV